MRNRLSHYVLQLSIIVSDSLYFWCVNGDTHVKNRVSRNAKLFPTPGTHVSRLHQLNTASKTTLCGRSTRQKNDVKKIDSSRGRNPLNS